MKRFRIQRGDEVLAEGVVWKDGRATTSASRLWDSVGQAFEWYSHDKPGASLIWIDLVREPGALALSGKLPSERFRELLMERHKLPPVNVEEFVRENQTLWDVLDERLGRA